MSRKESKEDLFRRTLTEARRSESFRKRLSRALEDLDGEGRRPGSRGGRRAPGVIDPFAGFRAGGEEALRGKLEDLDVEQLKDIVAEHGMDQARLAMKWKTPARLVDLIVSTVRDRLKKGNAFGPS